MLPENTIAWVPSWKSLILCKSELGPGLLHVHNLFTCSHHLPGLVTTEAQRGEGICPSSPSQTVAKTAFEPGPSGPPHLPLHLQPPSGLAPFSGFFSLGARIWAPAGSAGSVLPSPPQPQPQRSGTSQASSGMSIYGSVVPKRGQIYKLPLPRETQNNLCRVQCGGRAGSFVQGLDFSPGPGLTNSGVGRAPVPPRTSVSPSPKQRSWTTSFLKSFVN